MYILANFCLVGQLAMAYAALYVGYYLPTVMFLACPVVLIVFKKNYRRKAVCLALPLRFSYTPPRQNGQSTLQELSRPTLLGRREAKQHRSRSPTKMDDFDDAWVDEVRRGFNACAVFLWYPLYWISYD